MRFRSAVLAVATVAALFSASPGAQASAPDPQATHYNDAGGAGLVGPMATASYAYGLTPADLQRVYNVSAAVSAPTVAVVAAYDNPNVEADLAAYRSAFGLPACTTANGCFRKTNQNGTTTYPTADVGWGQEIALDVEMVSAACPNCKILLVEANSSNFSDLMVAVDYAASQANFVSNSWGTDEFSQESYYEPHFNKPGVVMTFSTGDNGYGVAYPASSQYVVAVGGTSLHLDANRNRSTEAAWSGAGSGCSAYITKPTWQTDVGCARRTVADVSAVADPQTGVAVYTSYGSTNGNWWVYGGTSASAPFIAGVFAAAGVPAPTAAPASLLYTSAESLVDITSGTNGLCSLLYLCGAVVGFDGPTGLGVPDGVAAFGAPENLAPVVTNVNKACSTTTNICRFILTANDPESQPLSYSWTASASNLRWAFFAFNRTGIRTITAAITDGTNITYKQMSVYCAYRYVDGWRIICT